MPPHKENHWNVATSSLSWITTWYNVSITSRFVLTYDLHHLGLNVMQRNFILSYSMKAIFIDKQSHRSSTDVNLNRLINALENDKRINSLNNHILNNYNLGDLRFATYDVWEGNSKTILILENFWHGPIHTKNENKRLLRI